MGCVPRGSRKEYREEILEVMPRKGRRSPTIQFDLLIAGFKSDAGSERGPERIVLGQAEPPWVHSSGRGQPIPSVCTSPLPGILASGPRSWPRSWLPLLDNFFLLLNQQNSTSSSRPIASTTSLRNSFQPFTPAYVLQSEIVLSCRGLYSSRFAGSIAELSLKAVSNSV